MTRAAERTDIGYLVRVHHDVRAAVVAAVIRLLVRPDRLRRGEALGYIVLDDVFVLDDLERIAAMLAL